MLYLPLSLCDCWFFIFFVPLVNKRGCINFKQKDHIIHEKVWEYRLSLNHKYNSNNWSILIGCESCPRRLRTTLAALKSIKTLVPLMKDAVNFHSPILTPLDEHIYLVLHIPVLSVLPRDTLTTTSVLIYF